jgi:hypothetical protein
MDKLIIVVIGVVVFSSLVGAIYYFTQGSDASPATYEKIGCFRDKPERAILTAEGTDIRLDGEYKKRQDPINKCFQVAKSKGHKIFAIQDGGWCASTADLGSYNKYGNANECADGKGGPWANDVYKIL